MEQQRERIGFIGVGRMGRSMALNLHRAGFLVRVYDVSTAAMQAAAAAGLATADSPQAAVAYADVVILMLPSDDALQALMEGSDGLLRQLRTGQVVIDMSTSMLVT